MSYRSGHHSTSDDSSRYRTTEEMHLWRARDPGARLRRWLTAAGWWDDARETELRKASRQEVHLIGVHGQTTLVLLYSNLRTHSAPTFSSKLSETVTMESTQHACSPDGVFDGLAVGCF